MKKHSLKMLSALLLLTLLLSAAGCGIQYLQDAPLPTVPPAAATDTPEISQPAEASLPDRDGYYYDAESIILYLHAYGELPGNYITKAEARALGWEGGSVERFRDGAAIGGDRFGNREGLLPRADGRSYTECDLNTLGADSRGAERLIFSNDGLYFYTGDHYEHFTELSLSSEGELRWN